MVKTTHPTQHDKKNKNNSRQHVNPLIIRPAAAYFFDVSIANATMLNIRAIGGKTVIRIPDRDPMGEPQPKPGISLTAQIYTMPIISHGISANQKATFPIFIRVKLSAISSL